MPQYLVGAYMQVFKIFTVAALMATVGVGAVSAKSLRNAGVPTEFPPSSYTGKQYVDSKGCIFIRAGISGNVTWVPRVSRSRRQICGQRPTFAKAPVPNAPVVADTVSPVVKPVAQPAPKRVVRAPVAKPAVRTAVVAPTFAPAPKRVVRSVVKTPVIVQQNPIAVEPQLAPKPIVHQVANPCASASGYNQGYITNSGGRTVRCGPQIEDPTGGYVNAPQTIRVPRSQTRRIAAPKPTRVAAIAAAATPRNTGLEQRLTQIAQPTHPPKGYVAAWTDGRQNLARGRGTPKGRAQMEMVWTNTVPRRLVAVSTSQDTRRRIVIRVPRKELSQTAMVSRQANLSSKRVRRSGVQGGDR